MQAFRPGYDAVPGSVIAELKRCSTASAVPIQVVKHLPDVVAVSGAKHPPAPDEHGALAEMLISWHLIVAFFQPDPLSAIGGGGIRDDAILTKDMSLLVCENGHVCLACQVRHIEMVLWRQGTSTYLLMTAWLAVCDRIGADSDHMASPGLETVRVAGALNKVLHGVP